jgi:hypothetical protein
LGALVLAVVDEDLAAGDGADVADLGVGDAEFGGVV